MARAWPFENRPEGPPERIFTPREWVAGHEGADAVVIRIGVHDAQLVLVDSDGEWQRWVYESVEEAERVAHDLELPVTVGEYPEETRVRMNTHVRSAGDFEEGAYPEQGHVGPVIPYPENRPRTIEYPPGEESS